MTLPDHDTTTSMAQSHEGSATHKAGADSLPAPARIYTVFGAPPDMPDTFPATIHWIDWNQPQQTPCEPWPPRVPPCYGGSTGISRWTFDAHKRLVVETQIADAEKFHAFVFFQWGMRPCGQSKVSGRREPDGTHQVFGDSSQ